MKYIFYDKLCKDAINLRNKIFVEEQGFKNEFDDNDKKALHLVCYIDINPVATGRIFPDEEEGEYIIGRIAVAKEYRKLRLGSGILEALEQKAKELGAKSLSLSAQTRAGGFYEKNGYMASGEEYYDEFCPHVFMTKKLDY